MSFKHLPEARIPVSTYRLQFNNSFRFADAQKIVRYLHELGISEIYSSPYLGAKKGSLHGYDIVDHNILNPDIGTEEEYRRLMQELKKCGMGQILDIVPNHMGIGSENPWWLDILENGPSSAYADFFDIDWEPVKKELKDKVLLPVLGDQYGKVLEDQEIALSFQEGSFIINYYEHRFPVRPQTYINILRHNMEILERKLPADNPYLIEFLSIITSIEHLPPYTEKDADKVRERHREKEIIKKRLWKLYSEGSVIRAFIDNNVQIFNGVKGEPQSFDLFDNLISEQAYRLSHWRVAAEEINYRRFFDINELAAIRMENEAVFRETHKFIMQLIRKGHVTGLRVDHPDGLYDPEEYFRHLQRECFINSAIGAMENISGKTDITALEMELSGRFTERLRKNPLFKPFYIVGEKILIKGERMPEDWPIFSTTGYVFLNSVNGIFIDTAKAKEFEKIYSRFIKADLNYQDIIYEKKKLAMYVAMASEINTLAHYLNLISEKNRHTRDFTLYSLRSAILEVIAFFPVYRTYINQDGINERDTRYIESAVSKAKRKNPAVSESIYDFLKNVLLHNFHDCCTDKDKREWLDFAMRFQQLTGPVMAKGVEDTAFYVYNRFVSLNEVGGSPDRFGTLLEAFHGQNIERIKYWPHALITTATHDTKRGEDVRARINVLSEIPGEWRKRLASWNRLNRKNKIISEGQRLPDRNDEYLLYQTLIGAWPLSISDNEDYVSFKKRIKDYMLKAVREAKVNSSWISPNITYEDAMLLFIEKIMGPYPDSLFLKDFLHFQNKISRYGIFNSLSQTLLKITSPGSPDFYQGTELWDFSLVDPDNRRPVDYKERIAMLEEIKKREAEDGLVELLKELTANKDDGRIKMYLTWRALNYRKAERELFENGEYTPIEAFGERANNVCAFSRRLLNKDIIVAVPRLLAGIEQNAYSIPPGKKIWGGSYLAAPGKALRYRNIFTGEELTVKKHNDEESLLYLSDIFANFPAALLEAIEVS